MDKPKVYGKPTGIYSILKLIRNINKEVLIKKTDPAPVCLLNTPGMSLHLLFMSHSVYLLIQDGGLLICH